MVRLNVATLGASAGATTTWSLAAQLHVTVVLKISCQLREGSLRRIEPSPLIERDVFDGDRLVEAYELAPYLPSAELLYSGPVRPGGRIVLYAEGPLIDKTLRGADPAAVGPLSPWRGPRAALLPESVRSQLLQYPGDLLVLPDKLRWDFFHAAPEDQRCRFLRGDEWLALEGLGTGLELRTQLGGLRAEARVRDPEGRVASIALVMDSLRIDGEQRQASLLWRGSFCVAEPDLLPELQIWAGASERGRALEWPAVAEFDDASLAGTPLAWAVSRSDSASLEDAAAEVETVLLSDLTDEAPDVPSYPSTVLLSEGEQLDAAAAPATPFGTEHEFQEGTVLLGEADAEIARQTRPLPFEVTPRPLVTPAPIPGAPWTTTPTEPPALPRGDQQITLALGDWLDRVPTEPPPVAAPAEAETPWDAAARRRQAREPKLARDRTQPSPDLASLVLPTRAAERVVLLKPAAVEATTLSWQLRPPQDSITVILKQTCDLEDGQPARPRERSEPLSGELPAVAGGGLSVRYPSDFALFKPHADVVLVGHGYPHRPKGSIGEVRFRFGHPPHQLKRRFAVYGRRHWQHGGLGCTAPEPFERVELCYENAFGGPGYVRNPVGTGLSRNERGQTELPQLEDPARLCASPGDRPPPACPGPIAMRVLQRWRKIGRYDQAWLGERWPYFPADFDWTFYQGAPETQQLPYLQGDEPYEIAGARPDGALLTGSLPGLRQRCFRIASRPQGRELKEIALRLDTVVFDADAQQVHLIWRGVFETSTPDASDTLALFFLGEPLHEPVASSAVLGALAQMLAVATTTEAVAADEPPPAQSAEGSDSESVAVATATEADTADAIPDEELGPPGSGVWDLGEGQSLLALARQLAQQLEVDSGPWAAAEVEQRWRGQLASLGLSELATEAMPESTPPEAEPTTIEPPAPSSAPPGELDRRDLTGTDLRGADLAGRDLRHASLAGADLRDVDLSRALLDGADLQHADLARAKLCGASLTNADLRGACLREAVLEDACLAHAALGAADLTHCAAARADFREADAPQLLLCNADLAEAHFEQAKLARADLTGAVLDGAVFDGADLTRCRLFGAHGEKTSFLGAQLERAQADGARFPRACFEKALAAASLWEAAHLEEASFHSAVLVGSSFVRAHCQQGIFSAADLRRARLAGADATAAAFLKANLLRASLEGATLRRADFRGANLYGAASWRAITAGARFELALLGKTGLGGQP